MVRTIAGTTSGGAVHWSARGLSDLCSSDSFTVYSKDQSTDHGPVQGPLQGPPLGALFTGLRVVYQTSQTTDQSSQTRDQTSQTRAQTTDQSSQTTDHRPDLTDHRPDLTDHGPNLTDHGPNLTDHRPDLTDHGPNLTDHRPDLTDHGPNLTDHRPDLTDHRPDLTDHRPDLTDHRPDLTDHRPDLTDQSSDHRPNLTDHRPDLTDHGPNLTDHRPDLTDHRPNLKTTDQTSQTTDQTSQTTDQTSQTTDQSSRPELRPHRPELRPQTRPHRHRPDLTDHRPDHTDHGPNLTDHRPDLTDHRPELTDHRPQTRPHRPRTKPHRPQTRPHRPQTRVWSVVCEVWSVVCEVWSVVCEVWSVVCEVWSVVCEVWSVVCEVWSVVCEVWSVVCEVWSVVCEVWSVVCEVWSVVCEMVLPLINALHSLKNSATASVQSLHKDFTSEKQLYTKEPSVNLRDLGLTDINASQLDELVSRLLPEPQEPFSAPSRGGLVTFLHTASSTTNMVSILPRVYYTPVQARRLESGYNSPAETEAYTPAFMKGLLQREKAPDVQSLDQLIKHKGLPDNQQDAFKNGFAEGFLRSQAFTQRTQGYSISETGSVFLFVLTDSLRRTRLVLLVLLLIGIYGLSKTPFLSGKGSFSDAVRFRTTSGLDSAVDPVQMKNVTFDHVKGVEEAKNELQDVVEFLKNPQKFTVLGGKLPKGILLVGPPGTGKTLLARAVAGEADVPFYYASGSEFDEMFVGVGASRIRNLFKEAKANAPCVIFIDELDSVGGKRIESPMHPYSRQTINQLLAEMDGFKPNEGVIVIGATNFAEALDNALVRPGRFDMQVTVPRPDVKGRTEILNWYLSKIKVDSAVDAEIIARGTVGFSGAELENLVNQAALKAAVDEKEMVTMKDLEFAKDKILMGPERRSVEIDKNNKTITAYHESGHAIVAYYTKDAMPINKATIMPRGPTLGHVSLLPENDRWSETRAQLLAQMDVSMGGRVAEELILEMNTSPQVPPVTSMELPK
ncbi:hypothetical protein WMY93_029911 [Mugilogobius chulae]|uniref:AAA+ ATPase domain-containing protein n=1 Tax=Mugilogobius chulae TaxID=88201 RepID=A0AAW0MWB1_9GOBI